MSSSFCWMSLPACTADSRPYFEKTPSSTILANCFAASRGTLARHQKSVSAIHLGIHPGQSLSCLQMALNPRRKPNVNQLWHFSRIHPFGAKSFTPAAFRSLMARCRPECVRILSIWTFEPASGLKLFRNFALSLQTLSSSSWQV